MGASPKAKDIRFNLHATIANCCVQAGYDPNELSIHSKDSTLINELDIGKTSEDGSQNITLTFKDKKKRTIANSLTEHFFNSASISRQCHVDILLPQALPLDLDFDYAIGSAHVDLFKLPVRKLNIKTGGASVALDYSQKEPNPIVMDTLFTTVDMGEISLYDLGLMNLKHLKAEVLFGSLYIDLSGDMMQQTSVKANVGAGKLIIQLPDNKELPIKIMFNDSPLCSADFDRSFKKIGDNVFANAAYHKKPEKALNFDIKVKMGSVVFKKLSKKKKFKSQVSH
ncbi:MAG: hypothetical protein MI784_11585 [Cytophagales bacterium]|nr:hypothetical protein [Cytophagales bacterium]